MEDASPQERELMLGNLPAPARLLWHAVGKRSFERKIRRIRADLR